MITMFWPYVPEEAIKAVAEVLRTRWIGQGPKVDEVEKKFSEKFDIPYAATVFSGTAALHLALKLAFLEEGDEVITTPMTCTATNIPILYSKSKAVFADIQPNSMNIDPSDIRRKITAKTKAIMVVHWAGYPCDMAEILAIAKEYNLKVIEDAAHALGAKYQNQYIGRVGDYTCFSFQAIKQITTIDGGMLTMKEEQDYKRAKLLRWYGIDREFKGDIYWKYQIKEAGYKYHMNDVAATMLDVQLDNLDDILVRRQAMANQYLKELKNIAGLTLLERKPDRESGNWLFTIQVEKRNDFQRKLAENEIESHMVHVRNDICPIFGGKRLDLPVMNKVEDKYISIPLHNHLTDEDISKIISTIKSGW
ncbi:MAG: DegT/DnrJ/EryC1/StrS family aminotransferase [Patescibacteria group bacterium]|jgi:perosamine synthetase